MRTPIHATHTRVVLDVTLATYAEIKAALISRAGYRYPPGWDALDLSNVSIQARAASTGHARVERRKKGPKVAVDKDSPSRPLRRKRPIRGGRSR